MKVLFPYQKDAREAIAEAIRQRMPAALVVMATGLGKTVVASSFVKWWVDKKKSQILFLVHLWEAVGQAEKEFREMLGFDAKFQFLAGNERLDKDAQVVFSTFQTMHRRYRSMERHAFGLIVVDECHRSKANTYEPIVEYFRPEFKLAMTATEERMDGRDVRELFGNPVYEYPLAKALANRNLADVEYRVLVDNISQDTLRHIEKLIGKSDGKITRAMIDRSVFLAERTDLIAKTIKKEQRTRCKTIIFCNSRRHAVEVSKHFPDARTYFTGISSAVLEQRLEDFRAGDISTLIVVNKLNEAVDIPDADLMVFLRMTESKTIWLQQLGRGLRKKEGKHNVLVLDFVANCDRIRIVGQLASQISKCLGDSRESSEIHQSGLTFNFAAEARNIMELLERVENLPQAGPDETFKVGGEVWGTIPTLCTILKLGTDLVRRYIEKHHVRSMDGRTSMGTPCTFYPLSKIRAAFGKRLKLPQAERDLFLKVDGDLWGMSHKIAKHLGLSAPTIEKRGDSCRKCYGIANGRIATFYALSDIEKACADLLKEMPKANKHGIFKLQGETWGTSKAIGKIIGVSSPIVARKTPARFTRKGKTVDGNIRVFYPLSKAKKACASLIKKMPQAGPDGTFMKNGQKWATLNVLMRRFGLGWRTIKMRISSCRRIRGKDPGGTISDFYSLSEVKKACADLLKLPLANKKGIIKIQGEVWGHVDALAKILGISQPVIRSRTSFCRVIEGRSFRGVRCNFYSLSDMRKAFKKKPKQQGRRTKEKPA